MNIWSQNNELLKITMKCKKNKIKQNRRKIENK